MQSWSSEIPESEKAISFQTSNKYGFDQDPLWNELFVENFRRYAMGFVWPLLISSVHFDHALSNPHKIFKRIPHTESISNLSGKYLDFSCTVSRFV
jgi:hypothetical protein